MAQLSLDEAQKIIEAALAHARAHDLEPLAVSVIDARGAHKALAAEDGTSLRRAEIAYGKASAAVALGMGCRSIEKRARNRPHFATGVAHVTGGAFVAVPGGVLIRSGSGDTLGAVGISGDASENDELAAIAGIEAVGLIADPGSD